MTFEVYRVKELLDNNSYKKEYLDDIELDVMPALSKEIKIGNKKFKLLTIDIKEGKRILNVI